MPETNINDYSRGIRWAGERAGETCTQACTGTYRIGF